MFAFPVLGSLMGAYLLRKNLRTGVPDAVNTVAAMQVVYVTVAILGFAIFGTYGWQIGAYLIAMTTLAYMAQTGWHFLVRTRGHRSREDPPAMGGPAMRDASATVGGGSSPTLRLGLSAVVATVVVLALLVGVAYSGPLAQQVQTAQRQNTLTANELKALQQKAEQGDPEAQCNLGFLYRTGQGVPQDDVEAAHKWLNLAAAASMGCSEKRYADARDSLAKMMTPEQIAEAQKRANEWLAAFEKRKKGRSGGNVRLLRSLLNCYDDAVPAQGATGATIAQWIRAAADTYALEQRARPNVTCSGSLRRSANGEEPVIPGSYRSAAAARSSARAAAGLRHTRAMGCAPGFASMVYFPSWKYSGTSARESRQASVSGRTQVNVPPPSSFQPPVSLPSR